VIELFLRDASWHPRSKPGGRMPSYHLGRVDDRAFAFCSTRIVLIDDAPVDVRDLREVEICRRCLPEVRRQLAALAATKLDRDIATVVCPECNRKVRVTKRGLLRHHSAGAGYDNPACCGDLLWRVVDGQVVPA
jgi:hypothetical protein